MEQTVGILCEDEVWAERHSSPARREEGNIILLRHDVCGSLKRMQDNIMFAGEPCHVNTGLNTSQFKLGIYNRKKYYDWLCCLIMCNVQGHL
jgi:hypothetical protein